MQGTVQRTFPARSPNCLVLSEIKLQHVERSGSLDYGSLIQISF